MAREADAAAMPAGRSAYELLGAGYAPPLPFERRGSSEFWLLGGDDEHRADAASVLRMQGRLTAAHQRPHSKARAQSTEGDDCGTVGRVHFMCPGSLM
jgi:hypothetical protein